MRPTLIKDYMKLKSMKPYVHSDNTVPYSVYESIMEQQGKDPNNIQKNIHEKIKKDSFSKMLFILL